MKILVAIKGNEGLSYFRQASELARLKEADRILLAHVVDTGPRAEMDLGRERFLGRRHLGEGHAADLRAAEESRARAVLQDSRQALLDGGVEDGRISEVILRGKPNEELRRLADREDVDLVIAGGRGGKPGPHSVGKTARFLLDHAPHAALLVRP